MANPFTAENILKVVEPLIYAKRLVTLSILILLTLFFGYEASQTRVDAGFDKSIPLEHPYMQTLKKYQSDFGGGNTVLVALIKEDGDIYNEEFLERLKKATDDVFFLPGVDRSRVSSLFTPDVRFTEVVEGGFAGGNVIPAEYAPNQAMYDIIRDNVGKAGIIGRYVTTDQRGAMIFAELLEVDPITGEKLDYRIVAKDLENKIRGQYEDESIKVHIVGFAKVIGDVTDAAAQVALFFAIALGMTGVLLWLYTGSAKLSFVVLGCSLIAVVWEFGLLTVSGFGLDPFAILVPFLILSVSVSHGVQYVNAWVGEVDEGKTPFDASLETFRRLAIPGTTALITDVAGFATIYLIPIDIIREMSINAAYGTAAIIITNKMLCPIWLTYINIKDIEKFREKQVRRDNFGAGLWRSLSNITDRGPALVTLALAGILLGWSLYLYPKLLIGDAQEGVPELRPDSRYNQDSRAIVRNFEIGTDILKVIAETQPEACIRYPVMEEIERFAWHMDNTDGVQSTISLPQVAKIVNSQFAEGNPKFMILPRNQFVLVQSITPIPTSSGLLNPDCSAMAVFIFTKDHKATTIEHIVAEVKAFNEANSGTDVSMELATGNVGVMAATNEVVHEKEIVVVGYVYLVVLLFMWLSFKTVAGVLCVVLPLSLVSAMAYAVMVVMEIGMKVATLPVVALAVGIGVDYGIYVYSTILEGMSEKNMNLKEAYYRTLHKTGKAVVFTGVSLSGSVATWLLSDLQFQADMGVLLVFMFSMNMFGAILILPSLARFLVRMPPDKKGVE